MIRTLVPIILLMSAGSAGAQLYRCQTPTGIEYSDQPCSNGSRVQKQLTTPTAPSAENAKAAKEVAERDKARAQGIDREYEARQEAQAAAQAAQPRSSGAQLARACVDRYRPHLAYPDSVLIHGHEIVKDGFGTNLYVRVNTITNPRTPVAMDPITLAERFICRLDPATNETTLDRRWTDDYVERHKRGDRL